MKLQRGMKNFIVFLLAFLMAFEPFAVNMVYANSAPDSEDTDAQVEQLDEQEEEETELDENTDPEKLSQILDPEKTLSPNGEDGYLEYLYSLRGRSRKQLKEVTIYDKDGKEVTDVNEKIRIIEGAFAWGEWMNTISSAYAIMDDGCTDVFSFYNTLGNFVHGTLNAPNYLQAIQFAANKAALAGTFIAKVTGLKKLSDKISKIIKKKGNLAKGFKSIGKFYSKTIGKGIGTTLDFISMMHPPLGWKNLADGSVSTVQYWRWVARKTGLSKKDGYKAALKKFNEHLSAENKIDNRGAIIKDSKGIATSIGIGLTIIGIALDSYELAKSEDRQVGRVSYTLVKNVASLIFGVASLIAMFCAFPVGTIVSICALIWTCLTAIADQFGEYNKRWKAAYKNSYWYLYQSDPEFKSYYENRDDLTYDEKSACYVLFERQYGDDFKANARSFESANKNENSYYDDKSNEAISARVYIEMEKQGVVTSYYNRAVFKEPDLGNSDLLDLWKTKADYMSWKPTEEESVRAENRGFWGKVGHALNPMTYVSWIGDKIKSNEYNKTQAKYNYPKVWFNPDFTLIKRYQRWLTSNKKIVSKDIQPNNNDFYRAIGLRIEQSPFNYIPLVDYDTDRWSDDLLLQAFNADAFFVGVKEMMYFRNLIAPMTKEVKKFTENVTDEMKALKKSLDKSKGSEGLVTHLKTLVGYCQLATAKNDKSKGKDIYKKLRKLEAFNNWCAPSQFPGGEKELTPKNIVNYYWNDINAALTLDPRGIADQGDKCVLLLDGIKKNLDMASLMQDLYDEKQDALDNFDSEFTNKSFNEYLKENKFLNVDGGGFLDWLSDIYPAYKELDKYNKLYKKEIDKFAKAADDSNTGHNSWWFITWKNDEYHPQAVLDTLNNFMTDYKTLVKDYKKLIEEDSDFSNLTLTIDPEDEGIFAEDGIRADSVDESGNVIVIDVDEEINEANVTDLPEEVTDGDAGASIIAIGDE